MAVFGMRCRHGVAAERFYIVVTAESGSAAVKKARDIQRKDGWAIYDVEIKSLDT
jgi:hypothetical protein